MNTRRSVFVILAIVEVLMCGCPKQPISAQSPQEVSQINSQAAPPPTSNDKEKSPTAHPAAPQPKFPLRPPGPLGDLDGSFLASYDARRISVLAQQGPFVVVLGSSLKLYVPGRDIPPVQVLPDSYHALKDVAHTPFAAYLLLLPIEKGQETVTSQSKAIQELLSRIGAAQQEITEKWFTPEELDRQKTILQSTADLLRQTQATNSLARETLISFAHKLGPLMAQNAWDAGCTQVVESHRQMMTWKSELSTEDWNHLVAVNRGTHQARYRNAATQYFHWLFNDAGTSWSYPGESMRVLFVESLGKDEKTTDEFATVLIDADASQAFFGDAWRLSEDVLSEGAAHCITKLSETDRRKD
jgi:hypothetical protein